MSAAKPDHRLDRHLAMSAGRKRRAGREGWGEAASPADVGTGKPMMRFETWRAAAVRAGAILARFVIAYALLLGFSSTKHGVVRGLSPWGILEDS
jgi:hypothetical protein